MYAIIAIQWHQYIVKAGDELTVDRIKDAEEGSAVTFDTVLATFDESGKKVTVWKPFVKWSTVKATVSKLQKGEKMTIRKFQGKKRYRRKMWFRAHQSVLTIDAVS